MNFLFIISLSSGNTHADEEVSVQLNTKQGRFCKKNWFLSLTVGHSHVGMSCKHGITSDTDKVTVFARKRKLGDHKSVFSKF